MTNVLIRKENRDTVTEAQGEVNVKTNLGTSRTVDNTRS